MTVRCRRVSERYERGRLAIQADYDGVRPRQRFARRNGYQCFGWVEDLDFDTFVAFVAAAANKQSEPMSSLIPTQTSYSDQMN